jgi:integrase
MRLLLTDRFCDRAKVSAQTDYFDEKVSGLAFRISPTHRGWTLHYKLNSKQVRMTLGPYPALSLAAARAKALEAKSLLADGRDPRLLRATTFLAVAEDYLRREGASLRSLGKRTSTLRRLVFPVLGAMPIANIRRSDIVGLLDQIADVNGLVQADRTLGMISKILNYHASRSDDFSSPIVPGMYRTKPKDRARSRILTDDELRAIWRTAEASGTFGAFIRFLLLTGCRRNEAAEIQWSEISDGIWTLPASRNKTKVDLPRPLSSLALSLIPADGFIGAKGGITKKKAVFDAASGTSGWVTHDLRRSARSLMSRAGISSDIAERCLGHVIPGVRGIYDRHTYREEMLQAYEKLASLISRIVEDQPSVIPIRGRHA